MAISSRFRGDHLLMIIINQILVNLEGIDSRHITVVTITAGVIIKILRPWLSRTCIISHTTSTHNLTIRTTPKAITTSNSINKTSSNSNSSNSCSVQFKSSYAHY